ncbi:hypothetical protein AO242_04010 [Pseudomonas sp. ICMP 561]|nr:hypothetical protein AO242_04010 [Pseudomonas sp. ICMP 561]
MKSLANKFAPTSIGFAGNLEADLHCPACRIVLPGRRQLVGETVEAARRMKSLANKFAPTSIGFAGNLEADLHCPTCRNALPGRRQLVSEAR